MRRYKMISCLLLMVPLLVSCTQVKDVETLGASAITEDAFRAHVEFLSDDLLEGRGTGSHGIRIGGKYVATQFEMNGVEPGGENGTYFQTVPLVEYVATTPVRFEYVRSGRRVALRYFDDFVVNTGRAESRVIENSEIVFVGYGIDAPEQNWNDYKDIDVTGKVLLMLVNDPPSDDPEMFGGKAMTYYGRWTYKYEVGGLKGAAGVMLIHMTDKAGYPWQVVQSSWSGEMYMLKPKPGAPPKSRFEGWISLEKSKQLFEIAGLNINEMIEKAGTGDFQPVPLGVNLNIDLKSRVQDVVCQNVVGLIPGKISDEYVVYTSHIDHFGIGNPVDGDNIYNGALDNATGTGGLIEIGKAFKNLPEPPERSIVLIAVTGEEKGLLGSTYYAQNPTFPVNRIIANVNIDALTKFGRFKNLVLLGGDRTSLGEVCEQLAADHGLYMSPDTAPEKGFYFRSDQLSFARVGVPAVFLNSGNDFEGRPEGWGKEQSDDFTTNHYHQPSDEYDEDWNMEGIVQLTRLAFKLGYRIAALPEWPTWNKGEAFRAIREESLKGTVR